MSQVWHFIRIGVQVVTGFLAVAAIWLALPYALPLAVTSIAFNFMPE